MKFLWVDTWLHHKNRIGFILMCKAKNIDLVISRSPSEFMKEWDLVFIPTEYIEPAQFPLAKSIMYGPHNFIFVNGVWSKASSTQFPSNCFYNLLSEWVIDVENEFGGLSLDTKAVPFAVDIEKFKPRDNVKKEYDCFVYFKERNIDDLNYIISVLNGKKLRYKVIAYGSYNEDDFLETLHLSKFGIWIGRHESQGFAVQEALSCNIPLLVFDVTSMFQTYNINNEFTFANELGRYSLKATAIPYWESSCGISFTKQEDFLQNLEVMLSEYSRFQPREFIEKTLSPIACINRLLKETGL